MSKKLCIVCSDELADTDVFNIHYMCYQRHKQIFKNQKKKTEIEQPELTVRYCVYCKKKLQRKSTKPYHLKCVTENQDIHPCIIKVYRDIEHTSIYI